MPVPVVDVILYSTYFLLLFLALFWLLVLFTEKEEKLKRKLSTYPLFSALVPAYNEEDSIEATLRSLVKLQYPQEKVQIIVVNDGSTDHTAALVEKFIRQHPQRNIQLLSQPNGGKGSALNAGLAKATGEFYACLDADSFVSKNALQEMLPYFAEKDVAAVCPLLKVRNPRSVLQKVQWTEYIVNMLYKHLNAKLDCIHVTPGPFSVYRTEVIRTLGGYDEHTITEDLEIAIRLQKHQYRIVQTFDAIVETNAPNTWKELFRQRVRWYKGSIDNTLSYRKLIFNRAYGDFGMVRMPTIFLSGILAFLLTGLLVESLGRSIRNGFSSLQAINFDVITLLKYLRFDFHFLSLPLFKYFIAFTLVGMSFFAMIYAYRIVQEKITHYGRTWVSLITYLTIYGLFISVVWIYIGYLFIVHRRNVWT